MKIRLPRRCAYVVSAALLVLVSACGGSPGSTEEAESAIVLALPSEPDSLAAEQAKTSAGYAVLRNVEEGLLNRDPKTNELVGELATKWEQVEPTRWRFTLREGVDFHDGSPFNAEAAAFSLNRMWDRENVTILTSYLGPDMTFTAIDEHTLEVTTAEPDPLLAYRLFVSPIFSMKAFQDDPEQYTLKPVGTGPYKFVEWSKGQSITLEANNDWWGNDATDSLGKVNFDKATFVFRPEPTVRSGMVANGEADFGRWVTGEDCEAATTCKSTPGVETIFLRPDTTNPLLGDRRIREAISHAVNREQILTTILGGGVPAAQMVGPSAFGFNPNLAAPPFDLDKAKTLVAEAKADSAPVDTKITIVARQAFIQRGDEIVEVVADGLRQIGLTVDTRTQEQVAFEEMLRQARPIDPARAYLVLHSHGNELMDYGLSINSYLLCNSVVGTYCNPEVDAMQAKTSAIFGEERKAALQEIAKFVAEDYATLPIGQPEFHFQLADNLAWEPRLDGFILIKEMNRTAS